jgi:peptidoglycan hydrolase-like protein with peptidoglycan-binding domain
MGTFQRGDRGLDVTRLEIALMELGLYSGVLDDFFGPTLENSVRLYQARKGLLTTGISDDQTTAAILAEPSPRAASLRDKPADYRSLTLTASFETSIGPPECFSGLAGDFDGQGISFGVLQWNLGQGTLQPLLRKLDMAHPEVVKAAFGDGYQELRTMLTKSTREQLAWARKIQTANRRSLVEPWRSRFKALGATRECQQIQVEGASERFATARRLCRDYGLWSERAVALMFDIVVQNGSIGSQTHQKIVSESARIPGSLSREQQEVERMRIVANRRAEAARPEFVEDVRRRKLAIANGVGIVHGNGYDLERQYLLALKPALEEVPLTPIG